MAIISRYSANNSFETPDDLFDFCDDYYGPFDLDVCADQENSKCNRYYDTELDGLAYAWNGRSWCNPPYTSEPGQPSAITPWIKKGINELLGGYIELVLYLLPTTKTDQSWMSILTQYNFVQYVFIEGRVKFKGQKYGAAFPCLLVCLSHKFAGVKTLKKVNGVWSF